MSPIKIIGAGPGQAYDWGIVTSLPPLAVVGDYCSLKVRESESSSWKLWRLQKIEESVTYPWAMIGGPPLVASVAGSKTTASEAVQTTGAPSLTAPVAMEANFRAGANRLLTPGIGFGVVSLLLAGVSTGVVPLAGGVSIQLPLGGVIPGVLAKGASAIAGYSKIAGTGEANFLGLFVEMDPTRVG